MKKKKPTIGKYKKKIFFLQPKAYDLLTLTNSFEIRSFQKGKEGERRKGKKKFSFAKLSLSSENRFGSRSCKSSDRSVFS